MKILIVDDEPAIRDLLSFNLLQNGYTVYEADNGKDALALVEKENPDLVLLDLMLPEIDGLEVCRRLKANSLTKDIAIIMLTAKKDEIDKILGLELGADDYVTKPFSVREVMSRIKAVLRRRESHQGESMLYKAGKIEIDFKSHRVLLQDKEVELTPKEFDLLVLFVTNEGKAFSREELLTKIWGYEYYGDTRTVDVHVRHLRAKLDCAEAIETVRGKGYRFNVHKLQN